MSPASYAAKSWATGKADDRPEAMVEAIERVEAEVKRQEDALREALEIGPPPDGWEDENPGRTWPGISQEEYDFAFEYGVLAFEFVQDGDGVDSSKGDGSVLVVCKVSGEPIRYEHFPSWTRARMEFRPKPGSTSLTGDGEG